MTYGARQASWNINCHPRRVLDVDHFGSGGFEAPKGCDGPLEPQWGLDCNSAAGTHGAFNIAHGALAQYHHSRSSSFERIENASTPRRALRIEPVQPVV